MADEFKEQPALKGESAAPATNGSHAPEYGETQPETIESFPTSPVYSSDSAPYVTEAATESSNSQAVVKSEPPASPVVLAPPPKPPPPPPPPPEEEEGDEEERGMLRMSFMDHLGELRSRILKALGGVLVIFVASFAFCGPLWRIIAAPASTALKNLGLSPNLVAITPMELFNVIYLKLPLLVSVFIGSPWIFYQVWAFISPGLYKREKRWAVPFILSTAGLFLTGGCFAYFVAFRYGLEFLLGIGRDRDINVVPMVSINEYFDLFVNVTLGVGLVFEMPVVIFFLTLLRLASPRFLLRHSRYAILAITIIAAVVTPTPDVFNMMLFAVPMVLLFFVGIFLSYLLVLRREGKKFPWGAILLVALGIVVLAAATWALLVFGLHYRFILKPPYLIK